ncbi:hypothetical protein ACQPZJ_08135 [Actinoplanes sp. CA-054009]
MPGHQHAAAIPIWISAERFEPYLRHAGHDPDKACELYEWAAELNSAAFQAVHYVEVMLRNAIDIQLQVHRDESRSRIPWFLTPLGSDRKSQEEIDYAVATVRARLQKEDPRKDTRAQIVASLTFGFWANLLQTRHEDLVPRRDTVVVAADDAWPLYQKIHAYVCPPGRSFQPVEYLAFYADRAIQPEIARIRNRVDNIDWTAAESRRRRATGDARDQRIADIIDQSIADGWDGGRYQVLLLSAPGDPDHHTRTTKIPHARGRGFTQGQRYAVRQRLISADNTGDLL